jgi:predicted O-methyltransferase YrrM
MKATLHARPPAILPTLQEESRKLDFRMACEDLSGSLLRTLAASKPAGRLLELGTGTGIGTAWLLDGMGPDGTLVTVDNDSAVIAVAQRHLGHDSRVTFHNDDAAALLQRLEGTTFDLIFADTWAGKYTHLDLALRLLLRGALYVVDDMLPQPDWTSEHRQKAESLLEELAARSELTICPMAWSSGIIVAARTSGPATSQGPAR